MRDLCDAYSITAKAITGAGPLALAAESDIEIARQLVPVAATPNGLWGAFIIVTEDLDNHLFLPATVELYIEDLLPRPEIQAAVRSYKGLM